MSAKAILTSLHQCWRRGGGKWWAASSRVIRNIAFFSATTTSSTSSSGEIKWNGCCETCSRTVYCYQPAEQQSLSSLSFPLGWCFMTKSNSKSRLISPYDEIKKNGWWEVFTCGSWCVLIDIMEVWVLSVYQTTKSPWLVRESNSSELHDDFVKQQQI